MKRTLAILLMVALIVAVMPAAAFAATKYKIYRVNTKKDKLMVHTGPNDSKATRKGSLPKDAAVIVLQKQKSWWKIKSSRGLEGWVYSKYLKEGAYAKVNTEKSGLNIHKGENLSEKTVMGSAPKGARVEVRYVKGDLANIIYNKMNGWSARKYLAWIVNA